MFHILYQFDDNYAPYAGISMTSLLENNRDNDITIFCAALEVSKQNTDKITELVGEYGQQLVWIDTTESMRMIREMNVGTWNGSYATWLKMLILRDFSSDVSKLLYLDCDTLIYQNLKNLFDLDMKGYPVAAALDTVAQYHAKRLAIDEYYNAGVILFDLDVMRRESLDEKMLCHLRANFERYPVNDQDLLNDFFQGNIFRLPLQYNLQGFILPYSVEGYLSQYYKDYFYKADEIAEAKEHPAIVHFFRFLGNYPWEKNNMHPCKEAYLEQKVNSKWKDIEDVNGNNNIVYKIEKFLYKILNEKMFLKLYRLIVER